jgi:hypothetical protein
MLARPTQVKIHSVSFDTWCSNHPEDHSAKWCRELYPWKVFELIDYSPGLLGQAQYIYFGWLRYIVTVKEQFTGANGRPNFLIHLRMDPQSKSQQWLERQWNELFQLVVEPDGHFITLFTKKKDPSKELLRRFFGGDLTRIEIDRSLPVSGLLFRSLIAYVAEEIFGSLREYMSYDGLGSFEPFLSKGKDLWIAYSFTEEKAHRLGIRIGGKCRQLMVIYCHPTFTKHHRCQRSDVRILSLSELLCMGSAELRAHYLPQARFLLNHLRADLGPDGSLSSRELSKRINGDKELASPIETSQLREAKAGLGIVIGSSADAAYVFSCANLLNAALNRQLRLYQGTQQLEKEVYSFKAKLWEIIESLTQFPLPSVDIYVADGGLVLVTVEGVQFSFHCIPKTAIIRSFAASSKDTHQEWRGIRLQPIAGLVMDWARALMREEASIEVCCPGVINPDTPT